MFNTNHQNAVVEKIMKIFPYNFPTKTVKYLIFLAYQNFRIFNETFLNCDMNVLFEIHERG